jgi:apolipoprotein D and lipocalin family protein
MTLSLRLAAAAVSLLLAACSSDRPLEVASVDLASFQGPWYEIAKLPRPGKARCAETTLHYRLISETELVVVIECMDGSFDGPLRRVEALAVVADPRFPAKLALDFEGFPSDHWIVEVDADHTVAAIGDPSRQNLSILGRLPSLSPADYNTLVQRLQKKSFDVSRLERTLKPPGTGASNDDALRVTSRWRDTPP